MSLFFRNATILSMDKVHGVTPFSGDLLVEGDRIVAIGANLPVPAGARVIDAGRKLLMPGLVNAHLHSCETFFKGRYHGMPLEVWMLYSYPILMKEPISERLLYLRSLLTAMESLKAGVTTLVDDFFDPPGFDLNRLKLVFDAYDHAGIRANVSHCVIDKHVFDTMPYLRELMPQDLQDEVEGPSITPDEYIAYCQAVFATQHGRAGRLGFMISASAPQRCSTEMMQAGMGMAQAKGVAYHTHVLETKTQAVTGPKFYGRSLIRYMHEIGILTPNTTIAHSIWVSEDDIALMGEAGCSVAHNAISNLKLGSGIAPIRRLLDAGVHVGLGTDGLSSNDTARIFDVMRLAALLHEIATPDTERWMTAAEVLRSATIEGARTAMLGQVTGSLEVGKRADLLMIDLSGYDYMPLNRLDHHLVYCENGSSIRMVIANGEVVVEDGKLLTIDEAEIFAELGELLPAYLAEHAYLENLNARFEPYIREMYRRATVQNIGINRYQGDMPLWPGPDRRAG
ncbi:5-methylthioadenosine/S-adenosylhomocysteine deaminase [Rhizobium azibense]|uniref:5-methylthioadenosine/S-adenosylhomocysteine deaminase n=1 Tax=Rhizobium azibense TaxID=1136135 RepID=A0A4R3R5H6_9HYPH|nr:amidohydrolase [Rhizobium azibense]TCU29444.1 5-methylthioadenosine/S-adenosylhomocysteine deaminase [Rhizobium azibense]